MQNVAKGLEAAQEGTGRLLDATKDLLGGLAAVASRGVSWAADKVLPATSPHHHL